MHKVGFKKPINTKRANSGENKKVYLDNFKVVLAAMCLDADFKALKQLFDKAGR